MPTWRNRPMTAGGKSTTGRQLAGPPRACSAQTFVEIGPLFAVAPKAREHIVHFGDVGMGYGLEWYWCSLNPRPLFAVVDEVRIRHLAAAGGAYDNVTLAARMPQLWKRLGVTLEQPQENSALG